MAFRDFNLAIQRQFNVMKQHQLFKVTVGGDELWELYLGSFPDGSNPFFRKRTEHDCSCCRHFIKSVGGVVTIIGGNVVSLWDVSIGGHYQVVADAMAEKVKSCVIDNVFLSKEINVGIEKNHQMVDGEVIVWEHFHLTLPEKVVRSGDHIGSTLAETRSTHDLLSRALNTITTDAVDTVLELIAQNSLYRGEEHQYAVREFQKLQALFRATEEAEKDVFCWSMINLPQSITRIRNTAIGTLLVDLSEGMELENAVKAFESKVAPTNYKRPTALVTKAMVAQAQAKVEELGLISALERRYAVLEDITVNNVLFADRESKAKMGGVFDDIASSVTEKPQKFDKVEEVSIHDFIKYVMPHAKSIEVMMENRHAGNLVSLIAPCDMTAKGMFKWSNNFSWSYAGDLADSIKERVKRAGGNVSGDVCCRLSWFNYDDLDLHMMEPGRYEIYFATRNITSPSGGRLDVDMNAGVGETRTPVENIFYKTVTTMKPGLYDLFVHQFRKRETKDLGFEVEVEILGETFSFAYEKAVKQDERIKVARIQYRDSKFSIVESLPSSTVSKQLWGITTNVFHKVSTIMMSPNYWDDRAVGNKHYFFMLDGCKNDGQARGFFNEFLTEELNQHRKVLEIVGAKMKTEESDNQLSGLGFSSTQHNTLTCRVTGSFSRIIKIIF